MITEYLVIGINAAGFYALEEIRKHDSTGHIIAVNGEKPLPYKRTKVNKKFSPPGLNVDKFKLADSSWYKDNRIILLNNTKVVGLDTSSKTAVLNNGKKIKWGKLLISTGADSYCPDIPVFKNSVSVRTIEDAISVNSLIKNSESCLIYGLGIEAIETAAQLNRAGLAVTMAGRGSSMLSRYFSSPMVLMVEQLFLSKNIDIHYNIPLEKITRIRTDNSTLTGNKPVSIAGTNEIFDFLLYSLGISPKINLAEGTCLKIDKGIVVNERMETSITDIYAAGDCAQSECTAITDHWHSAQDQGRTAAANMAGSSRKWPEKLYRLKMEIFDEFFFSMRPFVVSDQKEFEVEESFLTSGSLRVFYYKENKLLGVEMTKDKLRAKLYEEAVNNKWDRVKVEDILS